MISRVRETRLDVLNTVFRSHFLSTLVEKSERVELRQGADLFVL